MRRWILLSLLVLMLASLSALPALRTKISNIAAATSTGILRRIVWQDRVGGVLFGNSYNYHGVPTSTTATTTTTTVRSTTSATGSLTNKLLSPSSPLAPIAYQQGQTPALQNQDQFSMMTSPEAAGQGSASGPGAPASIDAHTEPELPKLSAADFRAYNQLADMMNSYHNHFRHTWNIMYKTCTTGSRPGGMSIRSFLNQGLQLCRQLTLHHTIEEQYFFPPLAERMPAFAQNDHLISQHEQIHEGLVKLEEYLDECRGGIRELRLPELKDVMDSFCEVLWAHLDDEVRMLGAENMRRYWSKEEVAALNIG